MPARPLPNPMREPTISVQRAAELLGISRGSAYEAVRCGQVPNIRIERRPAVVSRRRLRFLGPGVPRRRGRCSCRAGRASKDEFLRVRALEARDALGCAAAPQRAAVRFLRLSQPKIGLHSYVPFGCDHRLSTVHDGGFLPLRGGRRPRRALTCDRCATFPARLPLRKPQSRRGADREPSRRWNARTPGTGRWVGPMPEATSR